MQGTASALLYYYCFLQLAKAELLVHRPTSVYQKKLGHGLSYDPVSDTHLRSAILQVRGGVFPLIYEKYVGTTIPVGSKLRVKQLLLSIPEIST
jgi:hypothetical protein